MRILSQAESASSSSGSRSDDLTKSPFIYVWIGLSAGVLLIVVLCVLQCVQRLRRVRHRRAGTPGDDFVSRNLVNTQTGAAAIVLQQGRVPEPDVTDDAALPRRNLARLSYTSTPSTNGASASFSHNYSHLRMLQLTDIADLLFSGDSSFTMGSLPSACEGATSSHPEYASQGKSHRRAAHSRSSSASAIDAEVPGFQEIHPLAASSGRPTHVRSNSLASQSQPLPQRRHSGEISHIRASSIGSNANLASAVYSAHVELEPGHLPQEESIAREAFQPNPLYSSDVDVSAPDEQ